MHYEKQRERRGLCCSKYFPRYMSREAVVARVSSIPEYKRGFRKVFGARGLTVGTIAKALAAFERTQLSGNAPFDRFMAGDEGAIGEAQKRGWGMFRGKARCIECHSFDASSPFFTDFRFHNTGVEALGRFLVTGRPEHVGAFKTPTLRGVELTAPYMHDGTEMTLLDVVKFYNRGGERNPALGSRVRPLHLTEAEMNDLVEFLRALTSDDVLREAQRAPPQTLVSTGLPSHSIMKK